MRFQTLVLLIGLLASTVHASLLFVGSADGVLGSSNVVLTIQQTPTEQGCVGWNGTADVTGSAACPGGLNPAITGGAELTGSSQTQTRTITQSGVTSASNLLVLLSLNEAVGNSVTIGQISLTIYAPDGTVLFNSGNLTAPVTSSLQGAELAFQLDGAEAALAEPFWSNPNNRFGLAALITDTSGSAETFSIADSSGFTISGSIPEPGSAELAILGLLTLGTVALRRKRSE